MNHNQTGGDVHYEENSSRNRVGNKEASQWVATPQGSRALMFSEQQTWQQRGVTHADREHSWFRRRQTVDEPWDEGMCLELSEPG